MKIKQSLQKFFSKFSRNKNTKKVNKLTPKRLKKRILQIVGILFVLVIIMFAWYAKDLPTPGKIQNRYPIESSQILDRNGKILYDVHGEEKRTVINSDEIPDIVKQATVSAEDKHFYKHIGIDVGGITRALYNNITGKYGYTSGGSTITQQYVKNALLSPKKTIDRKIKELILSLEIEAMYSKDEILTMYLNEIPYGSNAYGIEAASETYYDKQAKDLTLDEAAVLASLPQAPTYFSPYGQNPDELKARRDYVLDRMSEDGYITEDQATQAKGKEIAVVEQKENILAPHFVMYVKQKLIDMYGEKTVEEDGLKVTTTLDLDKQKMAEEAIADHYEQNLAYNADNAALVSLDPKTGQILAMVGSHDYFDTDNDGQVNVTISERQPGSSFKPIAYATAFKDKYSPSSILWDVKTDFGNYTPENYDKATHGPVTIRYALANSLNIPAVKILYLAGLDNVLNTAHEMGITTLNDPERYGLALVLGGGEVMPLDMATAFGVFADNGTLAETTPFLKIEDRDGNVLEEYQDGKNKKEVLDPQIAYEISSILSDNSARAATFGTNSPLYFGDRPVAAKTGTTDSYRDAWTNGYTPSLATSVWVGNNDNSPMNHAAGVTVAAPIFHEYMEKALADTPIEQFEKPEGIATVTVDKLSGKIPTDQSPETITDIFASWQVPKERDDIHVKVRICNACDGDKLADENCPESQVEERVYTNLHSEVPDNPNWENPVRYAAEALGIHINEAPTEVCDVNSIKPSVNITSPTNNESVSGNFDITTNASSNFGVRNVEFLIDNVKVGQADSSPYSYSYNANNLSTGSHQITARVNDNHDLSTSNTITINVTKDTSAPGAVKNVSLTPQSKSVQLSWTNPKDSDLSIARIYVSTKSGTLGIKNKEVAATPNAAGSTTISSLNSGTKYYFTIRTVDSSGNENSNVTQYTSTPL